MNTITKQLTNASSSPAEEEEKKENEKEEADILLEHPQWPALCEKYGRPDIPRKPAGSKSQDFPPGSLGARMARFEFSFQQNKGSVTSAAAEATVKSKLVPTTVSIYRLQGLAASLFDLSVLSIRLVLETDELDPVGGGDVDLSESESESEDGDELKEGALLRERKDGKGEESEAKNERGEEGKEDGRSPRRIGKERWVRREEELVGSTKPIGDSLPVGFGGKGAVVRIRIERMSSDDGEKA